MHKYLSVMLLGVLGDQLSKYYVVKFLSVGIPLAILPSLNLRLNYNKGVAFSMFNQYGSMMQIALIVMVSAILVGLVIGFLNTPKKNGWQLLALSLLISGAIGNLLDRIFLHQVVDFIDVYIKHWHWPTFNIADSLICIGVFILGIQMWRESLEG